MLQVAFLHNDFYAEYVVIDGKDTKCRERRRVGDGGRLGRRDVGNVIGRRGVAGNRRGLELERKDGGVDARQVEGPAGRVLARRQRERHEVDAGVRERLVGLVGHDLVEDGADARVGAVVAVEHELGGLQGRKSLLLCAGEAAGETAVLGGVGNDPREELAGVVERKTDLLRLGRRRDRDVLVAGELELLNEVLVGLRGELLALVLIEIDVIAPQRGLEGRRADTGKVGLVLKLKRDAELVVLHISRGLNPREPILSHGSRLYLRASSNSAEILGPTVVKSLNVLHSLA